LEPVSNKCNCTSKRQYLAQGSIFASDSACSYSVAQDVTVPDEFRSLIYCDELICDGGMELVHLQLPFAGGRPISASNSGDRLVSADVLVGPDGFARGIRIEQ
jgi:hypothetical protein